PRFPRPSRDASHIHSGHLPGKRLVESGDTGVLQIFGGSNGYRANGKIFFPVLESADHHVGEFACRLSKANVYNCLFSYFHLLVLVAYYGESKDVASLRTDTVIAIGIGSSAAAAASHLDAYACQRLSRRISDLSRNNQESADEGLFLYPRE